MPATPMLTAEESTRGRRWLRALVRDPRVTYAMRVGRLIRVAARSRPPSGPIVVKSVWGLANRVYGLLNAVAYAARYGRPLHVDWTDGMYAEAGVNAFPMIFSLRGVDSLAAMPDLRHPLPEICRGRLGEDCRSIWGSRQESIFSGFPDLDSWHLTSEGIYDGFVYCSRATYGRPFALAAGLPLSARNVWRRHVSFSQSMEADIADRAVPTDSNWIGVHYRCTDLKTNCSLERIAEIVKQSGCHSVYWASDLAESLDAIRRILSGYSIEGTRPLAGMPGDGRPIHLGLSPGQHREHLVGACVDLRSLAGCGVIVRKRQSTFGRLAAEVVAETLPRQVFIR